MAVHQERRHRLRLQVVEARNVQLERAGRYECHLRRHFGRRMQAIAPRIPDETEVPDQVVNRELAGKLEVNAREAAGIVQMLERRLAKKDRGAVRLVVVADRDGCAGRIGTDGDLARELRPETFDERIMRRGLIDLASQDERVPTLPPFFQYLNAIDGRRESRQRLVPQPPLRRLTLHEPGAAEGKNDRHEGSGSDPAPARSQRRQPGPRRRRGEIVAERNDVVTDR